MFALKKFITPFILPPGLFIVLLLGSGIWLVRHKKRVAGVFNVLLALIIWACSIAPVADFFMGRLEQQAEIPSSLNGDVIILLGGGIYGNVRDLTGRGAPSEEALSRLVTAVRAEKRLNVPVIVSGGAWRADRTPEAPVLRRFLADLGVPANRIILEDKSRDTGENARYCREICTRYGFKKPLLVTSAYHMRRSRAAFAQEGMAVHPLPANFKATPRESYTWLHYLPSSGALHGTSSALREEIGLLVYRLTP